jgi:hypothetical protein
MRLGVQFGGLGRVRHGVVLMAVRRMRMMPRTLVVAAVVLIRGFPVVPGGVVVVLGGLPMMLCGLLGHANLLAADCPTSARRHEDEGVAAS